MLTDLVLGATPIAGGALLGLLAGNAGNSRGPDFRATIKADLELLDKLPAEDAELRAALKQSIDVRIRDLVASTERSRQLRETAASYQGNWRDIVLFVCAVLFTIIWWNVPHSRSNWLVMFIVLIAIAVLAGLYAARDVLRGLARRRRGSAAGAS